MFKFKSEEVNRIEVAFAVLRECDLDWGTIGKVSDELYKKQAVARYNEVVMRLPIVRKALADTVNEGLIKVDMLPDDVDLYDNELRIQFEVNYPGIVELTVDLDKECWQIWSYDCQLDPDEQDDWISDWRF